MTELENAIQEYQTASSLRRKFFVRIQELIKEGIMVCNKDMAFDLGCSDIAIEKCYKYWAGVIHKKGGGKTISYSMHPEVLDLNVENIEKKVIKNPSGGPPKGHEPYNKNGEGGIAKKWTDENLDTLAELLEKWIDETISAKKFFWWKDWCFEVGILPPRVTEIAKVNSRFAEAYTRAKSIQESFITKGALLKRFDSNFSQFYLKRQYSENWKDPDKEKNEEQLILKTIQYVDAQRNNTSTQLPAEALPAEDSSSS